MKKFLVTICLAAFGIFAVSNALAYYYEAADVNGTGTIKYWLDSYGNGLNKAPEFTFTWSQATVNQDIYSINGNSVTSNIAAGNYNISITVENLQVDANEDGNYYTLVSDYSANLGTHYIPALPAIPLTGTYGQFSWSIDTDADIIWASYDFGDSGNYTNAVVNAWLAGIDIDYTGSANGIMDANIRWDRVRLDVNPVPEPSTMLLMGLGLGGLAVFGSKAKRRIKE